MWFGTERGVSRYDGEKFHHGLRNRRVYAVRDTPSGVVWLGTLDGRIYRFDGQKFSIFPLQDRVRDRRIWDIYSTPDGIMWFGTESGGVSRYDGKNIQRFTKKNGLANTIVHAIHHTPDEMMWFGTYDGGVSGYDGVAWTSLDTRDGLPANYVRAIDHDSQGFLWFGTVAGVTRYHRSTVPPKVRIVSAQTNETIHTNLTAIPHITTGTRVTIRYNAIDFKTHPAKRQYRLRILKENGETERDWQITKANALTTSSRRRASIPLKSLQLTETSNTPIRRP
jgi:ligand-binding sensor domain-containing protein